MQALKSQHNVGLFCPYSRSLLTLVWSWQANLESQSPTCNLITGTFIGLVLIIPPVTRLFYYMPANALAALVIVYVYI